MRVIQMLPVLAFGDAIGNDTIALDEALKKSGYESIVYADHLDERMKKLACQSSEYVPEAEDVILYHLSTGSDMNYRITTYPGRIMIMYHNITPAEFFDRYDPYSAKVCRDARRAAAYLGKKAMFAFADSAYNKAELVEMGYRCDIEVLPILIAFDDYKKKPTESVVAKYKDGVTNIVFTGRVAPNKKHEDIIAAFACYKKYYNPRSRLLLVGRNDFYPEYHYHQQKYAERLGVSDVIFTGQVKFPDILAYYSVADVFLCLSEHEGFCVPLVEAMMFDVPVVAYDSCAVGETLGGCGLLLPEKDPMITAAAVNRVVTDQALRTQMIEGERIRLKYFEHDRINARFIAAMDRFCR